MTEPIALLVIALAAYRVTRLIVDDTVWVSTRVRLKAWLVKQATTDEVTEDGYVYRVAKWGRGWFRFKLCQLISCSFCTGIWVTPPLVIAWQNLEWTHWPINIAAICGAQALLSSWEG